MLSLGLGMPGVYFWFLRFDIALLVLGKDGLLQGCCFEHMQASAMTIYLLVFDVL